MSGFAGAHEAEGYTAEWSDLLHHNGGDGSQAQSSCSADEVYPFGYPTTQCGARRPQSSSYPCFLNHVHNTHSLKDFQSQDMIW